MKLIRILTKLINWIYYLMVYNNTKVAYAFANYNFPIKKSNLIKVKQGEVFFVNTNNHIPVDLAVLFRYEFGKLVDTFNLPGVKVIEANNDYALIETIGIKLYLRSVSNLVTLYELFVEKIYDINLLTSSNHFIDIGMNVGYASLLFASLDTTELVLSYEPFKSTYEEALANFDLNPHIKNKIKPHNFGISDYDGIIKVPMMESGSGGASTNKDILALNGTQNLPVTEVQIKNIGTELEKLEGQKSVFCKIDCEGEEYPIFRYLHKTGKIAKSNGYIIEWHLKGAEEILSVLKDAGFTSLSLAKADSTSGMIYAFR